MGVTVTQTNGAVHTGVAITVSQGGVLQLLYGPKINGQWQWTDFAPEDWRDYTIEV